MQWDRPERFYHLAAAPLVRPVVWLLAKIRIEGAGNLPRRGPVLVAANHVSRLDPLVLAAACYRFGRTVRFLAVEGLFRLPVIGWVLRTARMIPVYRGEGPTRMVTDALPALRAGHLVLVYPEGTIPAPGQRLPARAGVGLLALRSGVPVIPAATVGLEGGGLRLRRRVLVVFGSPVKLDQWAGRHDRAASEEASDAVLAAVRGLHARYSGRLPG